MPVKGLCFENYIKFQIMHSENTENITEPLLLYLHFNGNANILKESKHTGNGIENSRYKIFFVKKKEGVGVLGRLSLSFSGKIKEREAIQTSRLGVPGIKQRQK